jgi:hypothetical protein
VCLATIHVRLRRLGLRYKKKSVRAADQDRPDVARRRQRWRTWQRYMDAARFVFLDERLNTKMIRLYGRAPRGERLVAAVPHGHWRTTTFIAGLRQSGVIAPLGARRPDDWGRVPRLCRAGACSRPPTR